MPILKYSLASVAVSREPNLHRMPHFPSVSFSSALELFLVMGKLQRYSDSCCSDLPYAHD